MDENEGDIDETTAQLFSIVGKQEEEEKKKKQQEDQKKREEEEKQKKEKEVEREKEREKERERARKEQEDRMKELKITALIERFDNIVEEEVVKALEENQWDIKKVSLRIYNSWGSFRH